MAWTAERPADFRGATLADVHVHPDSLVLLAPLPSDRNLALGRRATDEFGREVPLADGSIESEWLSGTPKVIGRQFTVDLGLDRSISRVRVLLGVTSFVQPEYFMRGYRIQAATQTSPDFWRLMAEERSNLTLDVDTQADSTWRFEDDDGYPLPRLGRYVRLELISQDRSNWVSLGEVQVFGTGFAEEGEIIDEFLSVAPVNVGRVLWRAATPEGTQVQMAVRGADDEQAWAEWQDAGQAGADALFGGPEPVTRLQYRGTLRTADPYHTPSLQRVTVEYDPVLVAQGVTDVIVPDTVRKGERTTVSIGATVDVEVGDYGVDMLRLEGVCLEVEELLLNGVALPHDETLERGYRWSCAPAEERTLVELAFQDRIDVLSVAVEVVGEGLFLHDRVPIQVQIASVDQARRDGYVNWQNGPEVAVRALGLPPDLLSEIEVGPSPFSPFRDERLDFRFVVGNVRNASRMVVEIFSLDGRRVRRLVQEGRARAYHFEWDGRDRDGQLVGPGLYLYEIRVAAGDGGARQRGAIAVAY